MTRQGKIRIIVFTIILVILGYTAISAAHGLYMNSVSKLIDTENMGDLTIDGSDFSPLFRLLGDGFNSFIGFIMYVGYCIAMFVISLILLLPLRLIGVRKSSVISAREYRISKRIMLVISGISVVIGLIFTRFTFIIPVFIFTAIWILLTFLIYILGLSKKAK